MVFSLCNDLWGPCLLSTVHCILHILHCTVNCTLYSIYFAQYFELCTLLTAPCTMSWLHCTLHTFQKAVGCLMLSHHLLPQWRLQWHPGTLDIVQYIVYTTLDILHTTHSGCGSSLASQNFASPISLNLGDQSKSAEGGYCS